jgi:phosphotransferase system enzyme I (PtsI)
MRQFNGLAINSGKIYARVCLYSAARQVPVTDRMLTDDAEVEADLRRFHDALSGCSAELDKIAASVTTTVGKVEAEIFTTQKHIMTDVAIVKAIERGVGIDRVNLEKTIVTVYGGYEEKFAGLDNEYLRERSTDIGEIRRRLLDFLFNTRPGFLCRGQTHCSRGKNRIIVARELTADMMAAMNLEHVLGIITEHGGVTSHAAIIARSVGVPAVSGIKGIFETVECGSLVLLDGDTGTVILEPSAETVRQRIPAEVVPGDDICLLETPPGMLALANASRLEDVKLAASVKADGIGLFRTEILFMREGRLLSVDEQYDYYAKAIEIMNGRPVTFRLLDIGGDKDLPFLRLQKEANPYLGWRGSRFLLGSSEIFTAQLRALARLGKRYTLNVLFPMVIDSRQLDQLVGAAGAAIAAEGTPPENIKIGAMLEVPSACLQAEEIFQRVDYASIGSNDLIQYLFAVDRNNEQVSDEYNPEHPVLWRLLRDLSITARKVNKPLSICGEMAGRSGMPTRLLDVGITALSVSPRLIPGVRKEMSLFPKR